jgi:hypothetical protein
MLRAEILSLPALLAPLALPSLRLQVCILPVHQEKTTGK